MASQVILKKSSVAARVPVVGDLAYGELALNYADGLLYFKKSDGTTIGTIGSAYTETDTLATVTGRNNTTTNSIKAGGKSSFGSGPLAGADKYALAIGQTNVSNVPTIAFSTSVIGNAVPETVIAKLLALDTSAVTAMAGYASISLTSGISGQLGKGQIIFHTSDEPSSEANNNTMTEKVRIAYNGYLGVGTATPTQRLEVAGTVYSTSGGFKFPDGTTQATAVTVTGTNTGDQISLPNPNAITFATTGGAAAGSTYTGAAVLTVDYATVGAAPAGHTHSYQAADNDLLAIGGLTGTSGYLKKTAADTWTLDTSTFLTAVSSAQVITGLGFTPENAANKNIANGYAGLDANKYLAVNIAANASTTYVERIQSESVVQIGADLNVASGLYIKNTGTTYSTVSNYIIFANNSTTTTSPSPIAGNISHTAQNSILVSASNTLILSGSGGGISSSNATMHVNGNFGIGQAVPTQKLEVAGTIYSTAGGFKFPDGTTQTTASTGSSGGTTAVTNITRTATGTGSQATFTVTSGVTVNSLLITENGVLQTPTTDYTVSGTTLTFITAPASGVAIQIRELGSLGTQESLSPFMLMGA